MHLMLAIDSYWVTWFPGALLATIGALMLGFKAVRMIVRVSDAIPELLDASQELRNNGGMSVKDDVQHIRREQARQARVQDGMNRTMVAHIAEDKAAFQRVEARLQP